MTQKTTDKPLFSELGLAEKLLKILEQLKFTTPTPIQHQCIPLALQGKDIVGIAQTGTGKTLAFGLPMIQKLATEKGQGLILLPTRELAQQVDEVLQQVGKAIGLRTVVLIGGASMYQQVKMIKKNPHVFIATPGRLIDHLKQKTFSLERVNTIVLDEADRMLDIGFMPQIRQILSLAPKERQTFMFSATMPAAIAEIAAKYMKMPLRIEVAPAGTPAANIEQEIFIISRESKIALLEKILNENKGTVLIFSRTKHGAHKINMAINQMGHTSSEIHSNKSQFQRRAALAGFKSGLYRILVATDIAARGIDVTGISIVLNFDLPDNPDDYVHRIGRTGRAGTSGKAISFATPSERYDIKTIERLIKKTIPIISTPVLPKSNIVIDTGSRGGGRSGFSKSSFPRRGGSTGRKPFVPFRPSYSKPSFGDKPAFANKPASNFDGNRNDRFDSKRPYVGTKINRTDSSEKDKFSSYYSREESHFGVDFNKVKSNKPFGEKRFDKPRSKFGAKPFHKKFDKFKPKKSF